MERHHGISVVRRHDILLERCGDVSRGRNNDVSLVHHQDVSVVRVHEVPLVRPYDVYCKSQTKPSLTLLRYVSVSELRSCLASRSILPFQVTLSWPPSGRFPRLI